MNIEIWLFVSITISSFIAGFYYGMKWQSFECADVQPLVESETLNETIRRIGK